MKRLFAIKDVSTKQIVEGLSFEKKQVAKQERKKLNGVGEDGKEKLPFNFVVTPGVDHKDYVSEQQFKEREQKYHETASRNASRRKRHQEPVESN